MSEFEDFLSLSRTIGNNVQKLRNNTQEFRKLSNKLGTVDDTHNLRETLRNVGHETHRLCSETSNQLSELQVVNIGNTDAATRKTQKSRLTEAFSETLNEFQILQRESAQKEKRAVAQARASLSEHQRPNITNNLVIFDDETGNAGDNVAQQQNMQALAQEENDMEAIKEREILLRQLESDIVNVNDIFKDLATMVHEQGDVIDSIEHNVESAHTRVEEGTKQLHKAGVYRKRSRKMYCCLLVIALVVVGALTLIIYFSVKK